VYLYTQHVTTAANQLTVTESFGRCFFFFFEDKTATLSVVSTQPLSFSALEEAIWQQHDT